MSVKSITKKGDYLLINLDEEKGTVKVNCKDFTIISHKEKEVKNLPAIATILTINDNACVEYEILMCLKKMKKEEKESYIKDFRRLEKLISKD